MLVTLPDGLYPFVDRRIPLAEMTMVEAPEELERLVREQAANNGVVFERDTPVELRCRMDAHPDATFLFCWPSEDSKLHMLVPTDFAKNRA